MADKISDRILSGNRGGMGGKFGEIEAIARLEFIAQTFDFELHGTLDYANTFVVSMLM